MQISTNRMRVTEGRASAGRHEAHANQHESHASHRGAGALRGAAELRGVGESARGALRVGSTRGAGESTRGGASAFASRHRPTRRYPTYALAPNPTVSAVSTAMPTFALSSSDVAKYAMPIAATTATAVSAIGPIGELVHAGAAGGGFGLRVSTNEHPLTSSATTATRSKAPLVCPNGDRDG